jgi:hypothetical protein
MTGLDVTVELQADSGGAVIRCGSCGAEQLLWATSESTAHGAATAFMDEHLRCGEEVRAALRDLDRGDHSVVTRLPTHRLR